MLQRIRLTIGLKIYAIIALCFLGFLGAIALEMRRFGASLEDQKRVELRHLTELALGIARDEHAAAQAGTISDAEAQKRAAARIGSLRYEKTEYFWINDMQTRVVMHPINKKLDGQSVVDMKDADGVYMFREFVDVTRREGRGYVKYRWPKPGATTPQPKLSYVEGFAPWGWVIGT